MAMLQQQDTITQATTSQTNPVFDGQQTEHLRAKKDDDVSLSSSPKVSDVVRTYNRCLLLAIGLVLIVAGTLGIFFNIVDLILSYSVAMELGYGGYRRYFTGTDDEEYTSFGFTAYGFWIGAVFILTGRFAIAARNNETRRTVTTFMVLSIVSAMLAVAMATLGVYGALNMTVLVGKFDCSGTICDKLRRIEAMAALLAVVGEIGFTVGFLATIIAGMTVCCKCQCCPATENYILKTVEPTA